MPLDGKQWREARWRDRAQEGFATAEFAVALPAVMVVLALVVGVLQAMLLHHRALHAASVGARLAARGESAAAVTAAVRRSGPDNSSVQMRDAGGLVVVRVTPHPPSAVAWAMPDLSGEVSALPEREFVDDAAPS